MATTDALERGRESFGRQAWAAARSAYASLGDEASLTLDDLESYAIAAHLVGEETESRNALARGYRKALQQQDVTRAARFAFWVAHSMIFTGEIGQTGGWLARARNLLSERGADCVEWGYFLVPPGVEKLLVAGDARAACETFAEAVATARRFADPNLLAMAGHGLGRALIRLGLTGEGMAVLDEVMVAIASGEVSPLIVGHAYCGVLEACQEVFDVRRAREWTAVLSRWCEGQPDLVPYRGPCLVHRVELMRLNGDWEEALEEARRACDWLSLPTSPEGPADAFYQLAELYRLRGDFNAAEAAYRQASRLGRPPDPGLALLWLARGLSDAAVTALQRALDETGAEDRARRSELLAAYIEVQLARGDCQSAQEAAAELSDLAAALDALPLQALAEQAQGSVLIARGDPRRALAPLRRSWAAWKQVEAPYEAARVRVLIGIACRELGDRDTAEIELDAARWLFLKLGAAPELARVEALAPGAGPKGAGGLTERELEVLRLVASGKTNRAIAAELFVSEHTVRRHLQNIFGKLGVSSRAGATAFAFQHGLA